MTLMTVDRKNDVRLEGQLSGADSRGFQTQRPNGIGHSNSYRLPDS
jgi:hypothetical protein